MNAVVSRRLAFVADSEARAKLADRFAAGTSIAKLSEETGISTTRLGYCLRQDLVERDAVPANVTGLAWAACLQHRTPQSIAKIRDEAKADLAEAIAAL